MKRLLAALLFCAAQQAHAQLPSPDPDDGAIKLPPGFRATVFADNLGRLRFLAVSANADVYVKTREGGLIALRDGWLYHSTNKAVLRYKMSPGELVPRGEPETIVQGLPDERQHNSKTFAFDDQGRLYVEVGSPSNSYGGENDRKLGAKGSDPTEFLKTHGGFWRFDASKKNHVVYIPFDAKGMPRGSYEVFAEGFAGKDEIANPNDARFRPNGLGVGPDGSLYVSDSQKGRVWRIFYVGEKK